MIGRRAAGATACTVGLKLSARYPGVKYLAYFDTAGEELVMRSLDIGDGEVGAVSRARRSRGNVRAELHRTSRPRWSKLHDSEAVIETEVGVEPPPEVPVELLRAVDIRNGDDEHLEFHVNSRGLRYAGPIDTTAFGCVHRCPLKMCRVWAVTLLLDLLVGQALLSYLNVSMSTIKPE